MRDLVEFLTAHLDEEGEAAREAVLRPWLSTDNYLDDANGGDVAQFEIAADARHAARHDPARVLAEVAAKRLLLDRWTALQARIDAEPDPEKRERLALTRHGLDMFAYQLGTVYADDPDYRDEWKP